MVSVPLRNNPEQGRRVIGGVLYGLGVLGGLTLLLLVFILPSFFSKNGGEELEAMAIGAVYALPPLLVYLWIPWVIDRYDPEPLWLLAGALVWGGVAACGVSALVNTVVEGVVTAVAGKGLGNIVGACISAPLVEEFTKGMAVFGIFMFCRREFDGVVDGVIYATFAALGFAAVENIIYYGNAARTEMASNKEGVLMGTFVLRGVLAPWGHPLYTSMTGIGFGLARETTKPWVRWMAPIGGYFFAAFLHCCWNTAATISNMLFIVMLPLWLLFVLGFLILLIFLVRRKGKIITDHLRDEVLMGNMTPWEVALVGSPVARIRATFSYGGGAGRKFIDAAARLALSKWHTGRATQGRKLTVSSDMIAPLRQELHRLRAEVSRTLGRPVQQPQPWQAPPMQQPNPNAQTPPPYYQQQPPPGGWRR